MKKSLFIISVLAGLLYACSPSTQLVSSWIDPSLTPETFHPFSKILVIARIKDETANRTAEDKIVAKLKSPAFPAYAYLLPSDTNKMQVDEKLKGQGFDGLIVMRLTDVNRTLNYQPGTYYGGFYGYRYSTPGYLSEDLTFYVETSLYSLTSGKLMWSGTTSTMNPSELDKTLDEIIYAIRNEFIKKGFIKEESK